MPIHFVNVDIGDKEMELNILLCTDERENV